MRSKYVVSVMWYGDPLCCLETYSCNQACKFLETIDFVYDGVQVNFYREHPYFKFDVDSILEILKK